MKMRSLMNPIRRHSTRISLPRLAMILGALIGACSDATLDLEVGRDHPALDHEDIRRRLGVTIRPGPDGYEGFETSTYECNTSTCDPWPFAAGIFSGCIEHVFQSSPGRSDDCNLRTTEAYVCAANTILATIEHPAPRDVRLLDAHGQGGTVIVPPQDAETNAELARIAMSLANNAFRDASWKLDAGEHHGCTAASLPQDAGQGRYAALAIAEELTLFLREALEAARRATDHAARHGTTVSDAARSRRGDAAAAATAMLAPFASRTLAAHMLVGGALENADGVATGLPGIAGVDTEGFFNRPRLSPAGATALELLRAAAIDPELIGEINDAGTVEIDQLVAGGSGVPAAHTVRRRIGLMRDQPQLANEENASAVYALLGVPRSAFTEAREYLRQEIRAFDRSRAAVLPPEPLATPGTTTATHGITLFAATRVPPQRLLPSYWSAVVRYDPTPALLSTSYTSFDSPPLALWRARPPAPDPAYQAGLLSPGHTYGAETNIPLPSGVSVDPHYVATSPGVDLTTIAGRTLASMLGELVNRGPSILESLCPGASCADERMARAHRTIVDALSEFRPTHAGGGESGDRAAPRYDTSTYLGEARACWFVHSNHDLRVEVPSSIPSDELLVVIGRDGLDCAVRGTLEGVPCTESMLAERTKELGTPWQLESGSWVRRLYQVENDVSSRPTRDTLAVFVVRRRAEYDGPPAPGMYEELTGWVLPLPDALTIGYRYCQSSVIMPALDRRVRDLVEPNPGSPSLPAMSCADVPTDFRIPLENELTEDGNGFESSWRHYLSLAQRAAAEADELGENLIRTGLTMDERAETAATELARICGVHINISSIADRIDAIPAAMPLPASGECTGYFVREGSQCVADPVLYAASRAGVDDDMARLRACIGADVVPWATLGDTAVCTWDANGSAPGGFCGNRPTGTACPSEAASLSECQARAPTGAEVAFAPASAALGIFQRPDPPRPNPDPSLPCEALASLRAAGLPRRERLAAAAEVLGSRLVNHETMAQLAQALSWEALPGDYSVVRYNGAPIISTGSVSASLGTDSRWPMGDWAHPASGLHGASCPGSIRLTAAGYTGPLFCLNTLVYTASGTSGHPRAERAMVNNLLGRAVMALRVMTATPLDGLVLPYYDVTAERYGLDPNRGLHAANVSMFYSPLPGNPNPPVLCANSGELNPRRQPLSEFAERACIVMGSSHCGSRRATPSSTSEWTSCYYDFGTESCWNHEDCRTGLPAAVYHVPLLFTQLRDQPSGTATRSAVAFWRRQMPLEVLSAVGRATQEMSRELLPSRDLQSLSMYYTQQHGVNGAPLADLMHGLGPERVGLTRADLLNGMELACVASRRAPTATVSNCTAPTAIRTLMDAERFSAYLECQANELAGEGANTVLRDVPRRVVDTFRERGARALGDGAGEFDAEVTDIRAGLFALVGLREAAASEISAFASELDGLRSAIASNAAAGEIEALMQWGRALDRITNCVTAIAQAPSTDFVGAGGRVAAAAATCVNSHLQIQLDSQIATLRRQVHDEELVSTFARFATSANGFGGRMSQHILAFLQALERMDGAIIRLHALQSEARRYLSLALMLESDGAHRHFSTDTAYRNLYSTQLSRYRRAHHRAIRAAYIARIALEQRLGMSLADISDDLFSTESPREWVDELCTLPSIDYDALRSSVPGTTGEREGDGTGFAAPDGFDGMWVGDYVRRLEQTFESYSFVHPFQEGIDTAVISLRDDVFRTRTFCADATSSMLFNGGTLDALESMTRPGWRIEGCDPDPEAIESTECIALERLEGDRPAGDIASDLPQPVGYHITFAEQGAKDGARIAQTVPAVARGRYRVSWYAAPGDSSAYARENIITVSGSQIHVSDFFTDQANGAGPWRRYWRFVDVGDEGDLVVAIEYPAALGGEPVDVRVAGVMFENVTDLVIGDVSSTRTVTGPDGNPLTVVIGDRGAPPPFLETGDTGLATRRTCPDHEGIAFRTTAWRYDCVRECAAGYGDVCPPSARETRCFWETSLNASADDLGARLRTGDAGFAAGNHNYRIESIAVNLVGTGLRDCGDRGTAGCYASGSFSYSILHVGRFPVRNARGETYYAPLFPGRIEGARALAAERYLTNPLSSADQALLAPPYTRDELQGRPLAGSLVLRIWDDPTLRFEERLEDVQVVLRYRYWQHQR